MEDTSPVIAGNSERTALKEWAVIVDAMARGDLIAMVRKGGIREQRAGFSVRHDRFLLYPTYFHEKAEELAPRLRPLLAASHDTRPPEGVIRLQYLADAVAVWSVSELDRLHAIELMHGLDWNAVTSRFWYRDRPGVQVVAVRVRRLLAPVDVPEIRRYGGCVSWVGLDQEVNVSGATPVIQDAVFDRALTQLQTVLGDPTTSH